MPERGRPGRREARDDPAAPGDDLARSRVPTRISVAAAGRGQERPQRARRRGRRSSRPAASSCTGIDVRLARPVVDQDDAGRAGRRGALAPSRRTCRRRARRARSRRRASPRGSALPAPFGSPAGAQRCRSTGAPSVPVMRADVDERLVACRPRGRDGGDARGAWNGIRAMLAGAPAATTESVGAKTWSLETAATEIASGAVPGEPTRCRAPNSSRSFPAEITGTTPGRDDVPDRLDQRVVGRLGLRAAAGEVDHVHAVGDRRLERGDDLGRVRDVADRRRDGEHAVVAEPGPRRHAREAGDRRVVRARPARSCRRRPRRSPRRGCRGTRRPGRTRGGPARPSPARGRRARRSPSASSTSRRPFGKPAG